MAGWRVYAGGYDSALNCYDFDADAGKMELLSVSDGGVNPSFLAWNHDCSHLYAVNEKDQPVGKVRAFAVNRADGKLASLGAASSGGQGPCHVSVHPSGKYVFAANYGSGHVSMLPVKSDGSVGEPSDIQHPGEHAHMAFCQASGDFLFVPCLGSDIVAQFSCDLAQGRLVPNNPPSVSLPVGSGPRHIIIDCDLAYVINELNNTVSTFAYDRSKGSLAPLGQALPSLPADFSGKSSCAHILVSPSKQFVYGSNRGHDSIVIFKRDRQSGKLGLVGYETGGGEIKNPRNFALSPDGAWMLVASQGADIITTFAVDQETGLLRRHSTTPSSKKPSFVGFVGKDRL